MKERKIASDITTAVVSVFLSFLSIALIVVFCLHSSFESILKPEGLADMANNIGYEGLVRNNPEIKKAFAGYGVDADNAKEFLDTKGVENVCALYSQDIFATFDGDVKSQREFNVKNVKAALVIDLDGIVNSVYNEDDKSASKSTIEKRVVSTIKKVDEKFIKSFPNKNKMSKEIDGNAMGWIFGSFSSSFQDIVLISVIVALIAIFVLRYYKFGGLIWISTILFIATAILAIIMILCVTGVIGYMFSMFVDKYALNAFVIVFSQGIVKGCIFTLSGAVVSIFVYVFLKKRFLKNEIEVEENE